MAQGRLAAVSDYLLRLYARAEEADATGYSTFALDGMCSILGADKAWWGVIAVSEAGPRLLSSFRSGLPPTWEAAWETVKQDDTLARSIAQTRNRTVALDSATLPATSGLVKLAEGFDLGQTLSIAVDMPDHGAFMFLSLYRGHARRAFTPEDKMINQLVVPHMHAAWRQNLRERLRVCGDQDDTGICKAFVDRDGKLVQREAGFAAVVAAHWPAWRGPQLPLLLREAIERARAAPGCWIGRGTWTVRTVPAGLLTLVELREATALDSLRPRELQVAKMFAEGATHKEIARLTGLTPSTVRHYLREAYAKLSVDNKAALANLINRQGAARGT